MRLYVNVWSTRLLLSVLVCTAVTDAYPQTFTKVTDSSNPVVVDAGPSGYTGASWIDYDGDGDLDLFVNNSTLYKNIGEGNFERIVTNLGTGQSLTTGNGNSWADYDNDGDLDAYIASQRSALYRNDGNDTFTQITDGDIGDTFASRGWSCAWADFDNDGYIDLAITHPAGFVPPSSSPTLNHVFKNSGPPNFSFTRVTGELSSGFQPYTVGTWSDFDLDGDMDYFIGSGPANGSLRRDFLFRNLLIESGQAQFERIASGLIATESQDGQVWNWIDYDNDGDMDAYLTNWGGPQGGVQNRLYRNDAGTFTRPNVGPIGTDRQVSLSSVWGDFDNDGAIDCYVANDNGQPDKYYRNNGDGTFSSVQNALIQNATRRGAAAGDYDNDGDLDLIVVGPGSGKALYRNDSENGNSWLSVICIGSNSNAAGIGAKVRVRATIDGSPVWQIREILAQNNFNGQNSMRAHFGLGKATLVDSLSITWPSGTVDVVANFLPNKLVTVTEGGTVTSVDDSRDGLQPRSFGLAQNYPNPFNPSTNIAYEIAAAGQVVLSIYNTLGEEVATLVDAIKAAGPHTVAWDGRDQNGQPVSSGLYIYKISHSSGTLTRKMLLLK